MMSLDGVPLQWMVTTCLMWVASSAVAAEFPDPTAPLTAGPAIAEDPGDKAKSALRLESVLTGPTRRKAIIDRVQYEVGDWIGDYQVIAIDRREVVLEAPVGRKTLHLHGRGSIRKTDG